MRAGGHSASWPGSQAIGASIFVGVSFLALGRQQPGLGFIGFIGPMKSKDKREERHYLLQELALTRQALQGLSLGSVTNHSIAP